MSDTDPRGAPLFLADHPALDFLNSRARPAGQAIEWIASGTDLIAWVEAAGHLAAGDADRLRDWPNAALDSAAREARTLREWFRALVDAASGQARAMVSEANAETLNAILRADSLWWELGTGAAPGLHLKQAIRAPTGLLHPIAESMARLLCEADFRRVRRCEGAGCTLHFLDTSKNGGRRWCSMAGCGNRAKAAQHRAKARAERGA